MPRSVNHVASRAKRKRILKLTRGYYGARKNVWTVAKNTWEKGLTYAFRDRKNKKRNFRALWIQRINAAARLEGLSYSRLMGALHAQGIEINRKVLADLAAALFVSLPSGSLRPAKRDQTVAVSEPRKGSGEGEEFQSVKRRIAISETTL